MRLEEWETRALDRTGGPELPSFGDGLVSVIVEHPSAPSAANVDAIRNRAAGQRRRKRPRHFCPAAR